MAREKVPVVRNSIDCATRSAAEEPRAPAPGGEGCELMATAGDPAPAARTRIRRVLCEPLASLGGTALVKEQIAMRHPNPEPESLRGVRPSHLQFQPATT